jgi:D-lyxose ketol-isomerase
MGNAQVNTAIEDSVIDETFKGVVSPAEIHRLGREEIVENRPGDVLVDAVKAFSAKGGFARTAGVQIDDGVKVSREAGGRLDLDTAKDVAAGVDLDAASTEIKD